MEMEIFYEDKSSTWEVPNNIRRQVDYLFTTHTVEYGQENTVLVKVPTEELKAVKKFQEQVHEMLISISQTNDALAKRLARRYYFNDLLLK